MKSITGHFNATSESLFEHLTGAQGQMANINSYSMSVYTSVNEIITRTLTSHLILMCIHLACNNHNNQSLMLDRKCHGTPTLPSTLVLALSPHPLSICACAWSHEKKVAGVRTLEASAAN